MKVMQLSERGAQHCPVTYSYAVQWLTIINQTKRVLQFILRKKGHPALL